MLRGRIPFALVVAALAVTPARAGTAAAETPRILFKDVRIFDGVADRLSAGSNVLIEGDRIARISTTAIVAEGATVIAGAGRVLMPGLIDAHTHLMFETIPQATALSSDVGFLNVAATRAASDMLLRGFTSVRDLGGPVF